MGKKLNMDINDMALHMKSISDDFALRLDTSGKWYVHWGSVEIKKGNCLHGGIGEHNTNLGDTVWIAFNHAITLPPDQYLVVNAYSKKRRAYRWNGVCFAQITEPD